MIVAMESRTVAELMTQAMAAQERQELATAEAGFRQVLAAMPTHALAWERLGVVAMQAGQATAAEAYLRQAVRLAPQSASAHTNLALVLADRSQPVEALAAARRAAELAPAVAAYHFNLGALNEKYNQWLASRDAYLQAVRMNPKFFEAWFNLSGVQRRLADPVAACAAVEQAMGCQPTSLGAILQYAEILEELGDHDRAQQAWEQAIQLDPANPEPWLSRARGLQARGELAASQAYLRRGLELDPHHREALFLWGRNQRQGHAWTEAVQTFRSLLARHPHHAAAHVQLAGALKSLQQLDEALEHYRLAEALQPGICRLELVHLMQHIGLWEGLDELVEQVVQHAMSPTVGQPSVPPFTLMCLPLATTGQQQLRCAQHWSVQCMARQGGPAEKFQSEVKVRSQERIRLGYLSGDFYSHATAWLITELIEAHDRTRFEVFAYSYGPDDQSPTRLRLGQAFDHFRELRELAPATAAATIRGDGIDVLIDLKGYTYGARPEILVARPAPVQVQYLGYPGTMGAPFIDYVLADKYVIPPEQRVNFSECVVYLPGCYQANARSLVVPDVPRARSEYHLPEDAFVFASFNNSYKLTRPMWDTWLRLLHRVPKSVLWLLESNACLTRRWFQEAEQRGLDRRRIIPAPIVPVGEHLSRHAVVDLFLDSFPVNAHTTASDALRMGVPLVTLSGSTFISRVAGSLLHHLGMDELITTQLADYESLAYRLAVDRERLAALRRKLRQALASTSLFDSRVMAGNIERAVEQMWRQHQQQRPPVSFEVALGSSV
jgi:predicted O-linked N-acetylglucosamine transferase (SPINDLY family)